MSEVLAPQTVQVTVGEKPNSGTPPLLETGVPSVIKQAEPAPAEDLISRVSKVKVEAAKPKETEETNPFSLSKEDYDKVQSDPTLLKFYKSMQSDYIRKTQEAAEVKKQAEKQMQQSQTWTAERLQQEINKPDFIQSAQVLTSSQPPPNSGLTAEEYSALNDKEKAQLSSMQTELHQMKMYNWQMQQKQQDEQLKNRYANYAPDIVDTTITKLVSGEVKADREVVWKALDYDDAVHRAYELGKQDRQLDTRDKSQSMSTIEGFTTTPHNSVPPPEQNESGTRYFQRLAQRRLAEAGQGRQR